MSPRPPEDYRTNTVSGAAAYERWRSANDPDDDYRDAMRDIYAECHMDEQDEDEDYDECGCSDPCCPCSGRKRGTP